MAPFYYYSAWWEGGPGSHFMFNKERWNQLLEFIKAVATAAAGYANIDMQAKLMRGTRPPYVAWLVQAPSFGRSRRI